VHHEAWFVRYREPVRQPDGSIKDRQRAKKLGSVRDYPRESQIKPLFAEFMRRLNAGRFTPEACMTLTDFVENFYLKYIEEKRASTRKSYTEIWNNHIPIVSVTFVCMSSERWMPAECSRQSPMKMT
jgi:hypothetical protein